MALDGRLDVAHNPPAVDVSAIVAECLCNSVRRQQIALFRTRDDSPLQKDAEPRHKLISNHLWVSMVASVDLRRGSEAWATE